MSSAPINVIKLSDTLSLCEYPATSGDRGLWLYDETRGMNLAMRAKSERDAFVEALEYYQQRLLTVEAEHKELQGKVDSFLSQFS